MFVCPKCNSTKILRFDISPHFCQMIDSYLANDAAQYNDEDLEIDDIDLPNIEIYYCLDCQTLCSRDKVIEIE